MRQMAINIGVHVTPNRLVDAKAGAGLERHSERSRRSLLEYELYPVIEVIRLGVTVVRHEGWSSGGTSGLGIVLHYDLVAVGVCQVKEEQRIVRKISVDMIPGERQIVMSDSARAYPRPAARRRRRNRTRHDRSPGPRIPVSPGSRQSVERSRGRTDVRAFSEIGARKVRNPASAKRHASGRPT